MEEVLKDNDSTTTENNDIKLFQKVIVFQNR